MLTSQSSPPTLLEFLERLQAIHPLAFETMVADYLHSTGRFLSVEVDALVDGVQFDVVAVERDPFGGAGTTWLFELKRYSRPIRSQLVAELAGRSLLVDRSARPHRMLLVVSSRLTAAAAERAAAMGIEVWDGHRLAQLLPDELVRNYLGLAGSPAAKLQENSRASTLAARFEFVAPGKTGSWSEYQRLISDVFEHLFCPPLDPPMYEHSDRERRNRRDVVLENSAREGFWALCREVYDAHYIVVDAKNYKGRLAKRPVIEVAHYLKPHGAGGLAFLACRAGAGPAALHAIREQWIAHRKLVVPLADVDLLAMVQDKANGVQPEDRIRYWVREFRLSL